MQNKGFSATQSLPVHGISIVIGIYINSALATGESIKGALVIIITGLLLNVLFDLIKNFCNGRGAPDQRVFLDNPVYIFNIIMHSAGKLNIVIGTFIRRF